MPTAWLILAKGQGRQHLGNPGYDDDIAMRYEYNAHVQYSKQVRAGDIVVISDGQLIVGVAEIAFIRSGPARRRHQVPVSGLPGDGHQGAQVWRVPLSLRQRPQVQRTDR